MVVQIFRVNMVPHFTAPTETEKKKKAGGIKLKVQSRLSTIYTIRKTYLYNFDPLKPHFYTVKLGFTRVYIIFFISAQKHILWVLIRTASGQSKQSLSKSDATEWDV